MDHVETDWTQHAATQFRDARAGKPERTCARRGTAGTSALQRYSDLPTCLTPASAGDHQSAGSDLGPGLSKDDGLSHDG
jgi:hypothetical protein